MRRPHGAAHLIVAFPHAGGSVLSGARLARSLPDRVGFATVALRGHDPLMSDEPDRDLNTIARQIAEEIAAIAPACPTKLVLLGNSFGALLAFEVARELELRPVNAHDRPDLHLVVSGFRSPSLPPSDPPLHRLPMTHLRAELNERVGQIFKDLDPVASDRQDAALRADLEMCETYRLSTPTRLHCAVTAIHLLRDVSVSAEELAAWQEVGATPIRIVALDAGHFPWLDAAPALGTLLTRLFDLRDMELRDTDLRDTDPREPDRPETDAPLAFGDTVKPAASASLQRTRGRFGEAPGP
ncbi:thioesterase II family protein [Rhodoplanes roseus]|uniref:Thioesterase domain-containing protein n=1 Tax=Rhodoplanes roseus TaxID=29409 RepID=A0A327L726_9BRAD|nr:alpha/beta fold hydrolase [Rhodoplanes roseus]RAI45733.1 hypothetical protein CH341_02620 [Rhodoplanes roseus]